MEDVRISIKTILPTLQDNVLDIVMDKLNSDGIESLSDCSLLNESDLSDILKPIQVRKLLAKWKAG